MQHAILTSSKSPTLLSQCSEYSRWSGRREGMLAELLDDIKSCLLQWISSTSDECRRKVVVIRYGLVLVSGLAGEQNVMGEWRGCNGECSDNYGWLSNDLEVSESQQQQRP